MNKKKRVLSIIIGLVLLSILLAACGADEPLPAVDTPTVSFDPISPTAAAAKVTEPSPVAADYWPTQAWRTTTPEEQGMDSEKLAEMVDLIMDQNQDIHSVTVIRNGYIVADAVIYPFEWDSKHIIHSVTKSITSALIGIAIEQGYIDDVEQPVLSLFPDRSAANNDANKSALTLEHLLTMTTGLECHDSYLYRWRGLNEMMAADDWVQHILDLPMAEEPGTRFEYCNGASFLLSAAIQEATGMTASSFAQAHLFNPLGISDVSWPSNPQGINIGWGEMRMQPHDMAKIGYLYLNEGRWDGEQIIPADWVTASTTKYIDATLQDGYGYQWWISNEGIYKALGYAGQYINVVPELDLVTVFTSNLAETDFALPDSLLENFILPAVVSSAPLPPNPSGLGLLDSRIQEAAQHKPEPVPPLPALARRVTGQTYLLDPNPLGWDSIAFTFAEEEVLLNLTYSPEEMQNTGAQAQDQSQIPYSVGLDNTYHLSPGEFGINMGMKGRWLPDDAFVIDYDLIGNTGRYLIRVMFQDDQLTLNVGSRGQATIIINGRLET